MAGPTLSAPASRARPTIEILEQAVAAGEPEAARLLARGYLEPGHLVEAHEPASRLVVAMAVRSGAGTVGDHPTRSGLYPTE
jgi:hypothetical protein